MAAKPPIDRERATEGAAVKMQRGFVNLLSPPRLGSRRFGIATASGQARRRGWPQALRRARFFGSGLMIGAGFWIPVFYGMAADPGPWGAAAALALFALAAAGSRKGR